MGLRHSSEKKANKAPVSAPELPATEIFNEQVEEVLLWQQQHTQRNLEVHWREENQREEQRRIEAIHAWQLQQQEREKIQQQQQLLQKRLQEQQVWNEDVRRRDQRLMQPQQQLQQPTSSLQTRNVVLPPARKLPTEQRVSPVENTVPDFTVRWSINEYVKEENAITIKVADNIVNLLQNGNTVPFIARYRKHMTHGMQSDKLRKVKNCYERAKLIQKSAVTIIKEIHQQGQLNVALNKYILTLKSLNDLQDIQSMFTGTEARLAKEARDAGLENPANSVMNATRIVPLLCYVKPTMENLRTEKQVENGIVHIIGDKINRDVYTIEKIKELTSFFIYKSEHPIEIHTMKAKDDATSANLKLRKNNQSDVNKYDAYNNFTMPVKSLKPNQVSAINAGEARKRLTVKIIIPNQFEQEFFEYCSNRYSDAFSASVPHKMLIIAAVNHAYNRLIKPIVMSKTRRDLTEKVEIINMDNFARDLNKALFNTPVTGTVIIGIDPGFQFGCKFAVVSEQGEELETGTIFPHEMDIPNAKDDAKRTLVRLVSTYKCTAVALGDGVASRETAIFLADLIQKGSFAPLNIAYQIVYDTGDSNLVSAASIARRLQDPMAEFLNIHSKQFAMGMYQYELPRKQLEMIINDLITEAVSFVGVDVNTASLLRLKRVAGLDDAIAKNIIAWRKSFGPFANRNDLLKVRGIGTKIFVQCAGFIRITPETAPGVSHDLYNPLDQTWIHPDNYDVAESFLAAANCNIRDLGKSIFTFPVNLLASTGHAKLAKKFGTTKDIIHIIVKGLTMKKGQDIREMKNEVSLFRKNVINFADLTIGTVLPGVVRNITHFGVFVDIGVEMNGLIHKSSMGSKTFSIGQRLETKVYKIEIARGRLNLIVQ